MYYGNIKKYDIANRSGGSGELCLSPDAGITVKAALTQKRGISSMDSPIRRETEKEILSGIGAGIY